MKLSGMQCCSMRKPYKTRTTTQHVDFQIPVGMELAIPYGGNCNGSCYGNNDGRPYVVHVSPPRWKHVCAIAQASLLCPGLEDQAATGS